jgi:arginine/serine-rich splicing factor 4/5/6
MQTKDADRQKEMRPSTTLFIVNFDVARVRERDIERFYEPYGESLKKRGGV